jgi:hypothetical protein
MKTNSIRGAAARYTARLSRKGTPCKGPFRDISRRRIQRLHSITSLARQVFQD